MEIYKNKYIKYKEKYLELKRKLVQKGGESNVFYLFTTGIAYTTNDSGENTRDGEAQLVDVWNSFLRRAIIDRIPGFINQIHISHHDILIDEVSRAAQENPEPLVEKFNNLLQRADIESDERIVTSKFTSEPLNLEEVRKLPHLVLDLAHIFRYDERVPRTIYTIYEDNPNPYPISSIYIGFLGNEYIDNGYSNRNILDVPLFTVNILETGDLQTTTYIDRFIDLEYKFNVFEPDDFFKDKIVNFKKSVIPDWRAKYGNLKDFDDTYNNQEVVKAVFDYLVELIYQRGIPEGELIAELKKQFISLLG